MQSPQGPYGPPQGPWGQPQQPGWMNADAGYAWQLKRLDDELQTWLLLAALGWFLGFWIVVGPAAWWKSGDFRLKYESMRAPVPGNVGVLRLLGVLTCALTAVVAVCAVGVVVFALAYASRLHPT